MITVPEKEYKLLLLQLVLLFVITINSIAVATYPFGVLAIISILIVIVASVLIVWMEITAPLYPTAITMFKWLTNYFRKNKDD